MMAKATALRKAAAGNRIPEAILMKHGVGEDQRLSWHNTYLEMAAERSADPQAQNDWEAFDAAAADGLENLLWKRSSARSKPQR
jgi:hypothetical protein